MLSKTNVALVVLFSVVTAGASAQLDENCTVSVLNRTAQVRRDGTWVLGNVPSNMGYVRARATCFENGVTRVGQSGYFRVPTNGVVTVDHISFQQIEPVPAKLTLTAPRSTLRTIDDTVQLNATVTFPTGQTLDMTAQGTNYTSSNAAVATVSETGLVTARASGTVIITAVNEGTLALFRVSVDAVADTDGDGMPDDFELANGFNPSNPADGATDADGDGLANTDEYQRGTNSRVSDTDGDGIRDGLEVQTGSDPLDPQSYDLARALRAIRLTPATLYMVVNTIEGEASRIVQVIGETIDGGTVDITARSRGTTYESSNLAVANFGPVDGQIFAGATGSATLTVRNSGFVATAPVSVTSFAPTALSVLPIPGYANNVAVAGNFAYVAAGLSGLQIVDITDRRAPRIAGAFDTLGNANDVRVLGTFAYVADGTNGLLVIDVAIPSQPQLVTTLDTPGTALDLAADGGLLYVADGAAGLQIIDVATPSSPVLVATVPVSGASVHGVDAAAGLAVVATTAGVRTINVAVPQQATVAGGVATTNPRDVKLVGTTALIADLEGSLRAVDVSDPTSPRIVATTAPEFGGMLNDVTVAGRFAFGADIFFINGIPVMDVSNPQTPFARGRIDFTPRDDGGLGIAADPTYVYLTAGEQSHKPGTVGDTVLYIAQYRAIEDRLGIPPTVRITSPAVGSSFVEGSSVNVTVTATDDVQVQMVSIAADGATVSTKETAPYTFTVPVPIGQTSMELQASAFDIGGNLGVSDKILVSVTRDLTPPTVSIDYPSNGQTLASGLLTVSISASDASGIGHVELLVNGTLHATDTTAPYQFEYLLPNVSGTITFGARAYDRAGNSATATTVSVTIFRDDPPQATMTITPAGPDGLFHGGEVVVTGTATDDRRVSSVELLVNGESVQTISRRVAPFAFNAYPLPAGTTTVTVRVTDSAGKDTTLAPAIYNVKPTFALGKVPLPGRTYDVAVHGSHAYTSGTEGVYIVSVETPEAPSIKGWIDTPGSAREIKLVAPYLFVADGEEGLQVIDVSNANAPVLAATFRTFGSAYSLAYREGVLYVGTQFGFEILDVRDPRGPRRIGSQATARAVGSLAVENGALVALVDEPIVEELVDVAVFDVTNLSQPVARGSVQIQTAFWSSVQVKGGRAYISAERDFYVVDISGATPQLLGSTPNLDDVHYGYSDARIVGNMAIASSSEFLINSAVLVGVGDPTRMRHIGKIDFSSLGVYFGTAIEVDPELVYTTALSKHIESAHFSPDGVTSALYVGRYNTVTDAAGVVPQVSIAAPAAGRTVGAGEAVLLRAEASDDVAIASVALLVNDVVVSESRVPPLEFLYHAPTGAGTFVVTAKATDYAGLTTTSVPVLVTVVTDTVAPSVQITNPRPGKSVLTAGTRVKATAVDNVSVMSVEFLVNGQVVATDTAYPYEFDYQPPAGMIAATIVARATDAAGNVGTSAPVSASFFTPQSLGITGLPLRYLIFVPLLDVAASATHAYVVGPPGDDGTLYVVDIRNPSGPQLVGSAPAPYATSVRVYGNYVYAGNNGEMFVFDVTNPAQPVRVAHTTSGGRVAVSGLKAITSATFIGTKVHDISTPTALSTSHLTNVVGAVAAENDRLVIAGSALFAYQGQTLWAGPALKPAYETWFATVSMFDGFIAATDRNYITVTDFDEKMTWSRVLTWEPDPNEWTQVTDAEAYEDILAATHLSSGGVALYDVSDRRNPVLRTVLQFPGARRLYGVSLTPTHVIAAGIASGGGSVLVVGQYRAFSDSAGIAPSVTLAPFSGAATAGRLFNLRATASDDVGVAGVTFVVNGVDVHTDTIWPYEFNYLVPAGVTSLDVQARAADYGGRTTVSPTQSIAVTP